MDITFETDFYVYNAHFPYFAIDENEDTYFWSDSNQNVGKKFCIIFDEPKYLTCLNFKTGKKDGNYDYLRGGIVESYFFVETREICQFKQGVCQVRFTEEPILSNKLCMITKEKTEAWLTIREIELGFFFNSPRNQCPTLK